MDSIRAVSRTWRRGGKGESRARHLPLSNSREALWRMVQTHCIDLHACGPVHRQALSPDFVLFDLDPPDEEDVLRLCVRVAALPGARRSTSR